jgi:hypothetical protein
VLTFDVLYRRQGAGAGHHAAVSVGREQARWGSTFPGCGADRGCVWLPQQRTACRTRSNRAPRIGGRLLELCGVVPGGTVLGGSVQHGVSVGMGGCGVHDAGPTAHLHSCDLASVQWIGLAITGSPVVYCSAYRCRSTNPVPRCAMSLCRCSLGGSDRAVWPRLCSCWSP